MGNIKENLLKRYGIGEYLLALIGCIIEYKSLKELLFSELQNVEWEFIALVILLMLFGALFIMAPMAVLDIARKRFGMKPKSEN